MAAATPAAGPPVAMPFIKNLASSDSRLRLRAVAALEAFLARRGALTPADAARLWTGLFHALWMADRPRAQAALAGRLAHLVFALDDDAAAETWLRAGWAVLSARWAAVDALRLDKFLLLARRLVAAHVALAARAPAVALRVLAATAFAAADDALALGLRLHVLDVWVDELAREGALEPADARADFVARCGALVDALRSCPVKSVRRRAEESYADPRLPWAGGAAGDAAGDAGDGAVDDESWDGFDD